MEKQKTLQIKNTTGDADFIPKYETKYASGMDLKAYLKESIVLKPFTRQLIFTGIKVAIPQGYEAQIRPRSGLALKHGITVLNTPGTIDADYRGEIGVILINLSNETYTIKHKDRIAQMVIAPVEQLNRETVNVLVETERGAGGFGHTGTK
jgi:dUTP pyrophosphatase